MRWPRRFKKDRLLDWQQKHFDSGRPGNREDIAAHRPYFFLFTSATSIVWTTTCDRENVTQRVCFQCFTVPAQTSHALKENAAPGDETRTAKTPRALVVSAGCCASLRLLPAAVQHESRIAILRQKLHHLGQRQLQLGF